MVGIPSYLALMIDWKEGDAVELDYLGNSLCLRKMRPPGGG